MSTKIMAAVWPLQMSPTDKAVLVSLADNANDEGVCWPSIAKISERTCLSERTITRAIKSLCEDGFLVCNDRNGRSNMYTVVAVTPDRLSPHPRQAVTPPLTQCHPTPDTVSPRTVIEPKRNRKGTVSRATSLPDGFYPDETGVNLSTSFCLSLQNELEKFKDYHKAKGSTMKDWQAAWRTWARNAKAWSRSAPKQARAEENAAVIAGLTGKQREDHDRTIDITTTTTVSRS